MSDKIRMGERRRARSRSGSRSPPPQDWRNVKIKEEPKIESSSEGHRDRRRERRSRSRGSRERERGHREDRDRDRNEHRHRSRGRDDRDRGERHLPLHEVRVKEERRSGSRSPVRRDRDRRQDQNNDRDRRGGGGGDRGRGDDGTRRHDQGRRDRDDRSRDRERGGRDGRRDGDRGTRDVKRERDWDNFFNPDSSMSREANVKRERDNNNDRGQGMQMEEYGTSFKEDDDKKKLDKEKPNFGLSGKLTEETNTFRGVVIKYSEPPEARKPVNTRWRLYPFKDGEALEVMYIHRQSAYLLGRDRKIADIPVDHPSCSKQHAVIQYRIVPYQKPNGQKGRRIRPYVIDLESANGTYVNGDRIEPKRYVELIEKDVLKFGFSSREYVLLHEHSKDDDPMDDVFDKSPSPE